MLRVISFHSIEFLASTAITCLVLFTILFTNPVIITRQRNTKECLAGRCGNEFFWSFLSFLFKFFYCQTAIPSCRLLLLLPLNCLRPCCAGSLRMLSPFTLPFTSHPSIHPVHPLLYSPVVFLSFIHFTHSSTTTHPTIIVTRNDKHLIRLFTPPSIHPSIPLTTPLS